MNHQKKAYIFALLAVALWSTVATAFEITLRYLDFLQMLLVASLVSLISLFLILIIQGKLSLLKEYTTGEYLKSALLGALNPCLYYIILFKAYDLLPAQEAQTLNYTWAIMVVILSIPLLGQKIKLRSFGAIFISFVGVIIIASKGDMSGMSFSDPIGVLLAVGSSVIWALFWIFNIRDKRDETAKLFLNFFFGFIFILVISLLFTDFPKFSSEALLSAGYVGLFEMGITFVFWLKAIKLSTSTAKVSSLIYLSPFMSLIFINFVLEEKIQSSTVVGLILIIGGIILQKLSDNKD